MASVGITFLKERFVEICLLVQNSKGGPHRHHGDIHRKYFVWRKLHMCDAGACLLISELVQ
jgi:hypothetical protein